MIQADKVRHGGRYVKDLTTGFVRHGILSVPSALALAEATTPQQAPVPSVAGILGIGGDTGQGSPPIVLAYEGRERDDAYAQGQGQTPDLPTLTTTLGRDLTVKVHAAEAETGDATFGVSVEPAIFGDAAATPLEAGQAAQSFIEDLIQTGRLDLGPARNIMFALSPDGNDTHTTHVLLPDPDGSLVLKRKHFDCGFCERGVGTARLACV
jgi:hypothetical protein